METKFFFGNPKNYGIDLVLEYLSRTKINSIKTSSIPLAQFWKSDTHSKKLKELLSELGISETEPSIHFEYPTLPTKGKGNASMTDVMIIGDNFKIAIEAKYTEYCESDFGFKRISKWLEESTKPNKLTELSDNRKNVLSSWCEMIQPFSKNSKIISSNIEDVISEINDMDYQFFHRTASACFNNKNNAYVVYQIFYDDNTKEKSNTYVEELKRFINTINPNNNLKFLIQKTKISLKQDFEKYDINSKDKDNPFILIKKGKKLYNIENSTFHIINPS